jgi:CheY-like chemotaxis protein
MSTVLLVDDEPGILTALETILRGEGHTVLSTENGARGLAKAKECEPDVIVSDWMMPVLDGVGLFAALQENPSLRSVPVVMMSATHPPPDLPLLGYLRKPFDIALLLRLIDKAGIRPRYTGALRPSLP